MESDEDQVQSLSGQEGGLAPALNALLPHTAADLLTF